MLLTYQISLIQVNKELSFLSIVHTPWNTLKCIGLHSKNYASIKNIKSAMKFQSYTAECYAHSFFIFIHFPSHWHFTISFLIFLPDWFYISADSAVCFFQKIFLDIKFCFSGKKVFYSFFYPSKSKINSSILNK